MSHLWQAATGQRLPLQKAGYRPRDRTPQGSVIDVVNAAPAHRFGAGFRKSSGGRVTPELRHLQVSLVRRTAPVSRSSLGGSRGTLSRVKCSPSSGTRVAVPNNTFRRSRQRGRGLRSLRRKSTRAISRSLPPTEGATSGKPGDDVVDDDFKAVDDDKKKS
jgi:hypothetical protein